MSLLRINNISTDINLSKAQISKIIQLGGSFGFWLGSLCKKSLTFVAILLARDTLPAISHKIFETNTSFHVK